MEKYIFNGNNGLWYELMGDYYFPRLTVPATKEQPIGLWGRQHRSYLKDRHPALYNALLLSGELPSYLANIDQQAEAMLSQLVEQLAQRQVVTEQFKASTQMAWVCRMNNIRASAMETVEKDIIALCAKWRWGLFLAAETAEKSV